ncbi:MAG: type IV secretory system conjugative DNA transfer family protein, partial [Bifidobacterium sp.]|nr:type IV secretory system conjugative DNA transfer family protein [Bifidobacterium sp.]
MARNNRLRQPSGWSPETIVAAIVVGVVSVVVFGAYGAWWLGCLLRDGFAPSGLGVMQVVAGLARKEIPWPGVFGWAGLAAEILAVALAALAAFLVYRRATAHSSRVDHAAPYLGRGRDVATMTVEHAEASARRLHVDSPLPGIKVGAFLHGKGHYYMTYEDMMLVLAGPRTGKTTSLAIPAIMDAPGPVLTTSNKRDIVDAVRGPRSRKGRVYVFDPQQIVHERQDWWWNPLSYVTDDTRARKLA